MTRKEKEKEKWEEELNKQWGHLANCPLAKWHKWFIRYQIKKAKEEILEKFEKERKKLGILTGVAVGEIKEKLKKEI